MTKRGLCSSKYRAGNFLVFFEGEMPSSMEVCLLVLNLIITWCAGIRSASWSSGNRGNNGRIVGGLIIFDVLVQLLM